MNILNSKKTLILIVIAVSAALYLNTLPNGFIYDDHIQIEGNPWITDIRNLPGIFISHAFAYRSDHQLSDTYRPVLFAIYTVEYYVFALKPWGWHLTNTLFHAVNSALVFLIASHLLNAGAASDKKDRGQLIFPLIGALFFAAHPVNTEAVAWVACVPELSYTLFYLLSLYLYIKYSRGGISHAGAFYALSIASFFLSVFSKETALILLPVLIIYDYIRNGGIKAKDLTRHLPYWAVGCAYIVLRFYALHGIVGLKSARHDALYYISNIFIISASYLLRLILPMRLSLFNVVGTASSALDPLFLLSFALVACLALIVWRLAKAFPEAMLFTSIIVLPLLPTFYLLSYNPDIYQIALMSERYLYLPSFGFAMLMALTLKRAHLAFRTKTASVILLSSVSVVLILYGIKTISRNAAWKDDFSIWQAAADEDPRNYFAHYMLGNVNNIKEDRTGALREFRETAELRPNFIGAHMRLGQIYYSMDERERAEAEFRAVVRVHPENDEALYYIALIQMDGGRWDEAIPVLNGALGYSGGLRSLKILNALAVSYARTGRLEETKRLLQEAYRIDPADKETLENMRYLKEPR